MYYAPHILQKEVFTDYTDEHGNPIFGEEGWEDVCRCRCDDNSTKEFKNENGEVYRPMYHVVCEGNVDVKGGDNVRCLYNGEVRGEGKVYMVKRTNYYSYTEIWI